MTRADLRAKIARLEKRLADLNAEAEEFDNRARYSGGENEADRAERAAARAQYNLWAEEISGVDRELRATWQALDALTERLAANVLNVSLAMPPIAATSSRRKALIIASAAGLSSTAFTGTETTTRVAAGAPR